MSGRTRVDTLSAIYRWHLYVRKRLSLPVGGPRTVLESDDHLRFCASFVFCGGRNTSLTSVVTGVF